MKRTDHPLPPDFISRIRGQFPTEHELFLASLSSVARTSVLLHPVKHHHCFRSAQRIEWSDSARILTERPSFTLDPFFHAGAYYPQESSSMFTGHVLRQLIAHLKAPEVLDLCAAPGGKSLLILYELLRGGRLIANEPVPDRNLILRQTLTKWGVPSYLITQNTIEDFVKSGKQFDVVLVDAPCSGEGMFRKDPAARGEWSMSNVAMCARRQTDLLSHVRKILRPGGYLIYSTCTYAPAENIDQVDRLADSGYFNSVNVNLPHDIPVRVIHGKSSTGYSFLPHEAPGEGFFISLLQHTGVRDSERLSQKKSAIVWRKHPIPEEWLDTSNPQLHTVIHHKNEACHLTPFSTDELHELATALRITEAGQPIGTHQKLKVFIPDHGLAMLSAVSSKAPLLEIDHQTALRYLSGQALQENPNNHSGWMIVTFQNARLGWIKQLPNRANNYYPDYLRIRKNLG
jgi:16S rRNA C967 or C1407 C5-methylase (RsmB/RsmF family)/NOL1/NOP2/fmu family ribosome biogenesis protein